MPDQPAVRRASQWRAALLVVCVAGCSGSGGGNAIIDPPPPPPLASVRITVLDESNNVHVPAAVVTVGDQTVSPGSDGSYILTNVPTGSTVVRVTAPGYDAFTRAVSLVTGSNLLNIALWQHDTLYEIQDFVAYRPPGASPVRGVLLVLFGGAPSVDTRPLVRGDLAYYQNLPLAGNVADFRNRMRALARAHDLVLMGARLNRLAPALYLDALESIGAASARPELTQAPLLLYGGSAGTCSVYELATQHSPRVIGFIVSKSAICLAEESSPAAAVPGYFFLGALDDPEIAKNTTAVFQQNRAAGAVWGIAIEPGAAHAQVADQALLFNWMAAVLTSRLPDSFTPGEPVALRPAQQSAGWLGNRTSFAIAAEPCYDGNRTSASWLPTEQTARDWQRMVSGGAATAVMPCPP